MAAVPEEIMRIVENFIKELSIEIPIEKAILFGSYVTGNYHPDSDIDLAIFSDYFEGMKRVDGIKYLLRKATKYRGVDLEPIPFTRSDYLKSDGFAKEILKNGIEINVN